MFDMTSSTCTYSLAGAALLLILVSRISHQQRVPVLKLIHRWLRWLLFASVFAYLLKVFELSSRPDWLHFTTGLALWFLCETGYNWIVINALSRSDIPLFPKFRETEDGDEWSSGNHLDKLEGWLDKNQFRQLIALKAELFDDLFLQTFIHESPDRTTRIQLLLVPGRKQAASIFYILCTNGKDGQRLITDNHSMPFGGYYPRSWIVTRKPLVGSLETLFQIHETRLSRTGFERVPFEEEPLEELNKQQNLLERLNTTHGFLNPLQFRQENGRLTPDGRYRLWKEMWLLAYLGRSIS